MKRKLINIASWLCAALMATFAVGCSSSRKAQKECAESEAVATETVAEPKDTVSVPAPAPEPDKTSPKTDEGSRIKLMYGVKPAPYKTLE